MDGGTGLDLDLEGVVHDLNNVFQTISEAAELLSADPRWAALAATIQRSVDQGRRITSGYVEKAGDFFDLDLIVGSAIEFCKDFLRASHLPQIKFVTDVQSGTRLRGIPAAWERVLVNLLVNAAQAAGAGGVVEVIARHTPEKVEITVADNGPGIPPAILPRVFEPHFSTKSSRAGLGLHIVHSIVTRNGGRVVASNSPSGCGAAFVITVPSA